MRKPSLIIGITMLLLLVGAITTLAIHLSNNEAPPIVAETKANVTDYFPLQTGNYWEYTYQSREAVGSNDIVSKDQVIRMEVLGNTRAGDYDLVEIHGDPIYFKPQGYFGLAVDVKSQKIYYIDDNLLQRLLTDFKKKRFKPDKIIEYGSILFEFPLHDGQTYGGEGQEQRQDNMYMYAVKRHGSYQISNNGTDRPLPLYQVSYACIADVLTYDFVPGLGITRTTYHHNGTVIDYNVKLTGWRIN